LFAGIVTVLQSRAINLFDTLSTDDLLKTTDMDIERPQIHAAGTANAIGRNPRTSGSRENDALDNLDTEFMARFTLVDLIACVYDGFLKPCALRIVRLITGGTGQ